MLKCEKKVSLEFLFHRKAFLSVFCIRIISVVDVSASQAGKKKEERRRKAKARERREKKEEEEAPPASRLTSFPSLIPPSIVEREEEGRETRVTNHSTCAA